MAVWKEVVGSNGQYLVSNTGKVKTAKTGRILKPAVDQRGYERVCLFKMDRCKTFKVHRLVATAFIPNEEMKAQVNHKDGNKRNNCVENLEWMTNAENMHHANVNGLRGGHTAFCESRKKAIIATDIHTGAQTYYDSILAAKKAIKSNHIQAVLNGDRSMAKGYTFRYANGGDAQCQN